MLEEQGQIGGRWDPDVALLRPTRVKSSQSFKRGTGSFGRAGNGEPPDHPRGVLAGSGENVFYSMDDLMNAADSLGNTALHLTVLSTDTVNPSPLTPVTRTPKPTVRGDCLTCADLVHGRWCTRIWRRSTG